MSESRASTNVLITGCSSGVGHATAARLVRSGRWTVYASARRVDTLAGLQDAGCRVLASDALPIEVARFGVDVICIEPGFIRSEFSATAIGSVAAADDGPYADFNAAVARGTREVYEGPFRRLGGEADDVAAAIGRALGKQRAPTRVPVTPSARLLIGLRRVLPDRAWDRVVGRQYGA